MSYTDQLMLFAGPLLLDVNEKNGLLMIKVTTLQILQVIPQALQPSDLF